MKHREKRNYTTQIEVVNANEGKSIEEEIRISLANKAPIEQTAPMIYTEKKDGVMPQYDPRTDRWELALDATDKWDKSERAESENAPDTENNVEQSNTNENA